MSLSEYDVRKEKVNLLRNAGIDPFTTTYDKSHCIQELRAISLAYNLPPAELLMSE
jgi:hypothetical protein